MLLGVMATDRSRPLAEALRPGRLEDLVGQSHLLSPGRSLYECLKTGHLHSMVLWGPPGTGKTTLARIFALCINCEKGPTDTPCGECVSCTQNSHRLDIAQLQNIEDLRMPRPSTIYRYIFQLLVRLGPHRKTHCP